MKKFLYNTLLASNFLLGLEHVAAMKQDIEVTSSTPTSQSIDIYSAIENGDLEQVKNFIEEDYTEIDEKVISVAIESGNDKIMNYLNKCRSKLNQLDSAIRSGAESSFKEICENYPYIICGFINSIKYKSNVFPELIQSHSWIINYLLSEASQEKAPQMVDWLRQEFDDLLCEASKDGKFELVKILIENAHCNVEAKKEKENTGSLCTPLGFAALHNHFDIVKYLVEECQANIEATDDNEVAPLLAACGCYCGNSSILDIVKYLVEECHCNVEVRDSNGSTPLHLAAIHKHLDIVKYLVEECHCDIEAEDSNGQTPLLAAASGGHLDTVKYLVEECHCSIDAKDNRGHTLLHSACMCYNLCLPRDDNTSLSDSVKDLIKECHCDAEVNGGGYSLPVGCIGYNKSYDDNILNLVKYIVEECHCNAKAKDENGCTPLHWAALCNHLETINYLIKECHCDVEAKDEDGCTPLYWAARNPNNDAFFTLAHFCNIEAKDNKGRTPLIFAAHSVGHSIDKVKYLVGVCLAKLPLLSSLSEGDWFYLYVKKHTDIRKRLKEALEKKDWKAVKEIINKEPCYAHINIEDTENGINLWSPNGKVNLLGFDSDPLEESTESSTGPSPTRGLVSLFQFAFRKGEIDTVRYIIEKGYSSEREQRIRFRDDDGRTLLHLASKEGCLDMVRYLAEEHSKMVEKESADWYWDLHKLNEKAEERVSHKAIKYLVEKWPGSIKGFFNKPIKDIEEDEIKRRFWDIVDDIKGRIGSPRNKKIDVIMGGGVKFYTLGYLIKKCPEYIEGFFNKPITEIKEAEIKQRYLDIVNYIGRSEIKRFSLVCLDIIEKIFGKPIKDIKEDDVKQIYWAAVCCYNYIRCFGISNKINLGSIKSLIEKCPKFIEEFFGRSITEIQEAEIEQNFLNATIRCFIEKCPKFTEEFFGKPITKIEEAEIAQSLLDIVNFIDANVVSRVKPDAIKFLVEACPEFVEELFNKPITEIKEAEIKQRFWDIVNFIEVELKDPRYEQLSAIKNSYIDANVVSRVKPDAIKFLVEACPEFVEEFFNKPITEIKEAEIKQRFWDIVNFIEVELKGPRYEQLSAIKNSYVNPATVSYLFDHPTFIEFIAKFFKFNGSIEIEEGEIKQRYWDVVNVIARSQEPRNIKLDKIIASQVNPAAIKYLVEKCSEVIEEFFYRPITGVKECEICSRFEDIVDYIRAEYPKNKIKKYIEARDEIGMTPLHMAASGGHLDVVKYLVEECHCDIHVMNKDNKTPLRLAFDKGDIGVTRFLLAIDKSFISYFYLAILNENLNMVKLLVEEFNCSVERRDQNGMYPLHYAAQGNNLDIVKYLVEEHHCNVEAKNSFNKTPLHIASEKGHLDIVKYLVEECHCSIEAKNNNGNTPLHMASEKGHLDIVQYLVDSCDENKRQEYVEAKNSFNKTPLHVASRYNQLGTVQYLVEGCHCNIEAKDNLGYTPLHIASGNGYLDIVKCLWDANCDVNVKSNNGHTPLLLAFVGNHLNVLSYLVKECHCDVEIKYGQASRTLLHRTVVSNNLAMLKCLIEECHANVDAKDGLGNAPLHIASGNGHLDIVKYLVEEGHCNVEVEDKKGNTPLYVAVQYGHFDIVKYLVEEGQCNIKDKEKTVKYLSSAIQRGTLDIVKYFIENCRFSIKPKKTSNFFPLHMASEKGHLNIVKYLVEECHCDVEAKDRLGMTPLRIASEKGDLGTVQYLVEECHCNIEAKDNEGMTPLHIASEKGHLGIVKYLVEECHCDVEAKNNRGETPLLHITFWGTLNMVKYLVEECHCNVEAKDNNGNTPLHVASYHGRLQTVQYLVETGHADVEAKDNKGNTPLHVASSEMGALGTVKYLVEECHCDVEAKSNDGVTPLHVASENGHLNIVKYLVEECHCNVEAKDNNGNTPLHVASRYDKLDTVQYLVEECHCNIEAKDEDGNTPLHVAAFSERFNFHTCNPEIVSYLVSRCNIEATNNAGQTPLHLAVQYFQVRPTQYLLKECQNRKIKIDTYINAKDNQGKSALDLAEHGPKKTLQDKLDKLKRK